MTKCTENHILANLNNFIELFYFVLWKDQCLSYSSIAVKGHHDQGNSYKKEHLVGAWLQLQRASLFVCGGEIISFLLFLLGYVFFSSSFPSSHFPFYPFPLSPLSQFTQEILSNPPPPTTFFYPKGVQRIPEALATSSILYFTSWLTQEGLGGVGQFASQLIRIPFIIYSDKCDSKILRAPGSGVMEEEEVGVHNVPDFEAHNFKKRKRKGTPNLHFVGTLDFWRCVHSLNFILLFDFWVMFAYSQCFCEANLVFSLLRNDTYWTH